MARTSTRKSSVKRSTTQSRKRKQVTKRPERVNVGRLFFFFCLIVLFTASIAVVGYVIFFRVVVAAEYSDIEEPIVFEEPVQPQPHTAQPPLRDQTRQDFRVAIIIDDMGYHQQVGRDLLALDLNLTFSFLPHAPFTSTMEEEAYRRGRTVMLHLPLEPHGREWDPGPGALYVGQSPEKRRQLLEENLQRVPHATGVNNHMGSRFTENSVPMDELIGLIDEHRMFFIDSYTTAHSRGMGTAKSQGVPTSRRHIFLDNVQQPAAICTQLGELVALAENRGDAIGIAHPHSETLEALSTCGAEILGRVTLVGADELVY